MSASKKSRKEQQRATGQKYQHPTREGIPHKKSKQPSPFPAFLTDEQDTIMQALLAGERLNLSQRRKNS